MTDWDLLELAAKAAGIEIDSHIGLTHDYFAIISTGKEWNPLTDDGDALRLAVELMNFEPYKSRGALPFFTASAEATRRAIVRAAAEIGKSL